MTTIYFICILPSFILSVWLLKHENKYVTVGQLFGCAILSVIPAMNVGIVMLSAVYALHTIGSKIARSKFMNRTIL